MFSAIEIGLPYFTQIEFRWRHCTSLQVVIGSFEIVWRCHLPCGHLHIGELFITAVRTHTSQDSLTVMCFMYIVYQTRPAPFLACFTQIFTSLGCTWLQVAI